MKALLNMAKEKRQQESSNQSSSITQKSHMNKFPQPPSQMSEQPEDFEGDYEPQIQEIIAYAQFIGINLPEQEDLLWIARQGLQAQLPPDWEQAETQNGEIAYTNTRTGQVMFQHPCDDYYRQMVIKQRKKTGSKLSIKQSSNSFQPIGSVASKAQPLKMREPEPIVDPLVKMQREKQQKRLEEQKRKQFEDKKTGVKQKYQSKKEQIEKQYKAKQEKSRTRFEQEIEAQKRQNIEKMSQQEKEQQKKREDEIRMFEKQIKQKEEKQLEQKTKKHREKLEKLYQQKKEEIKNQMQKKLKDEKKQVDDIYKEKYRQLEERQKAINQEASYMSSNVQLEEEISTLKSEIIRKKLAKYSQKLKEETEKQKIMYGEEVQKLQAAHNAKIKELQDKSNVEQSSVQSNQKLEQLIKEIQTYEKEQLKIFQYELEVMKEMKRFQLQEKLQEYKAKTNQLQKEKLSNVTKQMQKEFEKFKQLKEEEYNRILLQTEKKAKEDFLHGLKQLQKKFTQEEQIALLQNRKKSGNGSENVNLVEKQNLESLNRMYEQLEFRQKELRRQRQNIKLEIQNLRSQSNVTNPMLKMNEQQIKLYQLIQDKIRDGYKSK